jgi:hypothetical protein
MGRSGLNEIIKYWEVLAAIIGGFVFLVRHIYTLQRKLDSAVTEDKVREIIKAEMGELKTDISGLTTTIHSAVREFDQKAFQLAMQLSQDKRGNE